MGRMNIPNILTLVRIFLVPFLAVILLTRSEDFELWGVAILLGAAATDWLDGYLARRRRQVTTLGVLLDPIADKFLIAAAFIALVELDLAPAWMVVIIIGREVVVIGLRAVAAAQGFSVPVSELGKIKMVMQVCAAALLILGNRYEVLAGMGTVALWLVVFFALVSAARYFHQFWRGLNARSEQRRAQLLVLPPPEKRPNVIAK
jgi:CDP-diacylglycerol--glycerol-3-phosphate 3-phosphatidyltransferase